MTLSWMNTCIIEKTLPANLLVYIDLDSGTSIGCQLHNYIRAWPAGVCAAFLGKPEAHRTFVLVPRRKTSEMRTTSDIGTYLGGSTVIFHTL
jgi:hypothetical protein